MAQGFVQGVTIVAGAFIAYCVIGALVLCVKDRFFPNL